MTISPISELSQMFNQTVPTGSTGNSDGNDFSSLINKVSGAQKDPYMDNLPVASDKMKDKLSGTNTSENINTEKNDNLKNKISDSKSEKNKESDSLSGDHKDVVSDSKKNDATSKLKDEIINEAATTLGIDPEELENILAELGITAADLCNTENVSALVAQIMGDGDMMALITDESASDMVMQLNVNIESVIQEIAEEFSVPAEQLENWSLEEPVVDFSENIDKAVKTLNSDNENVIADDETFIEVTNTKVEADASAQTENTNNQSSEKHFSNEKHEDNKSMADMNVSAPVVNDNINNTQQIFETETVSYKSDVDSENIISQLREQIRVQVDRDVTSLSMQLNPENLGTVNLTVAAKEGNVTAYLTTTNEAVQAAIEAQLASLKESLEQQGLKIEAIEVAVGAHEFEQNLEQGNDRNDAQEKMGEELKKATRRLNINGFLSDEDIEELDEDEIVTAKMMRADGNSMDYKV